MSSHPGITRLNICDWSLSRGGRGSNLISRGVNTLRWGFETHYTALNLIYARMNGGWLWARGGKRSDGADGGARRTLHQRLHQIMMKKTPHLRGPQGWGVERGGEAGADSFIIVAVSVKLKVAASVFFFFFFFNWRFTFSWSILQLSKIPLRQINKTLLVLYIWFYMIMHV